MASSEIYGESSLIPLLNTERQVVLRKATSVVVYDHASRQMAMLNTEHDGVNCPTCHQPLTSQSREEQDAASMGSPDVIDPQYFRMLNHSLSEGPTPAEPPSPQRRLVQDARAPGQILPDRPPNPEFTTNSPVPTDPHGISSSAFSPDYFRRFFVEERVLGRGGKGVVLLVAHVLDGVRLGQFACKRVPVGDDHEWLRKILTEVQTLQNLSHQNLVSYRHVWLEDVQLSKFGPSVPSAFILQQYCNGGDLHNYVCGPATPSITTEQLKNRVRRRSKVGGDRPSVVDEPRKLSLDEIYSFFKDIASGLRFLHASGYIHRDLKPSNCLLHQVGGELRVLVSDFGEVQATTAVRKSTGATGTISYCAPEVLRQESPGGPYQNFTIKSDIFSLGMILYFLCFATLPYRGACVLNEEDENLDDLRHEILHWTGLDEAKHRRPELPEKLYVFLRRLLAINPQHRPTAAEVDHAIRTGGGLSDVSSTSASQDISQSDRIMLIDGDNRSASTTLRSSTQRTAQSTSISRRSSSRLRQLSRTSNLPEPTEDDDDRNSSRSPPQDLTMFALSPTQESRIDFPPPLRRTSWDGTGAERSPLLLPPPPRPRRTWRLLALSQQASLRQGLRIVLLLGKITSLISSCGASAARPLVVYPLLTAAVLEYTVPLRAWFIVGTSILHLVLLVSLAQKQTLCVLEPRDTY